MGAGCTVPPRNGNGTIPYGGGGLCNLQPATYRSLCPAPPLWCGTGWDWKRYSMLLKSMHFNLPLWCGKGWWIDSIEIQ